MSVELQELDRLLDEAEAVIADAEMNSPRICQHAHQAPWMPDCTITATSWIEFSCAPTYHKYICQALVDAIYAADPNKKCRCNKTITECWTLLPI